MVASLLESNKIGYQTDDLVAYFFAQKKYLFHLKLKSLIWYSKESQVVSLIPTVGSRDKQSIQQIEELFDFKI